MNRHKGQLIFFYILGAYNSISLDFIDMIPEKNSFLTNFTQRFQTGTAHIDMLNSEENWKMFVPNEQRGPCFTYDPLRLHLCLTCASLICVLFVCVI